MRYQIRSYRRFKQHSVPTPNKHFSHNKHTLFALAKMCLFVEEEDFGKINFAKCAYYEWAQLQMLLTEILLT